MIEQNLATKQDIADLKRDNKELEVKMEQKIEQIRSDLAGDLKDLEYRMTMKLGTMMVVAVGAMAALTRVL